MFKNNSSINSIVLRLSTDKPVRKTPSQVKGLIIKTFPDEPIVPFIDGSYRNQYLYPRVQIKILNEQIHFVGIKEGVEPILSVVEKLESMNFGNITFGINKKEIGVEEDKFKSVSKQIRYKFLTPWIALNNPNLKKFKSLHDDNKIQFLLKLLNQNIIFIAKELGIKLNNKVHSELKLDSLFPKIVNDGQVGAFKGEFQTNFLLPNFLGIGIGITKGYGVMFSQYNPSDFNFDSKIITPSTLDGKSIEIPSIKSPIKTSNAIPIQMSDQQKSREPDSKEPNYNKAKFHLRKHND